MNRIYYSNKGRDSKQNRSMWKKRVHGGKDREVISVFMKTRSQGSHPEMLCESIFDMLECGARRISFNVFPVIFRADNDILLYKTTVHYFDH